jgi:pilus assembly protein Flp/PilA
MSALYRRLLIASSVDSEEGQTLVEFGLILALIAVVCITVLTALGTDIEAQLNTVAAAI